MTTPFTGPLHLAGISGTTFPAGEGPSVAEEIGRSNPLATISYLDSDVRTLAGVLSGPISSDDLRGKSFTELNSTQHFISNGRENNNLSIFTGVSWGRTIMIAGSSGTAYFSTEGGIDNSFRLMPAGLNSGVTNQSIFQMDVNPTSDTVVAVMSAGYAARTTNGGTTWTALPRNLNSGGTGNSFQALYHQPGTTNWYAGANLGFASRSTDDGATWSAMPRNLGTTSANIIDITSTSTGRLIAVMSNGYASYSDNNGTSWTSLPRGLGSTSTGANNNAVHARGTTIIVVRTGGNISRSTDNGETWADISNPAGSSALLNVAYVGNTWYVMGVANTLLASTDDGATWSTVASNLDVAVDIQVGIVNNGQLFLGGIAGYTSRTSMNWTRLTDGLNSGNTGANFQDVKANGNTLIAISTERQASRSTDGGATWSALTAGLANSTKNIFSMDVNRSSNVWIVGQADGTASRSVNDGAGWAALPAGLNSGATPSGSFVSGLAVNGSGTWMATLRFGYAARSTNDGFSWSASTRGLNTGNSAGTVDVIFGVGQNGFVAVDQSGFASYSTDNGATWNTLTRGLHSLRTVTPSGYGTRGNNAWVGWSDGTISHSSDAGATWSLWGIHNQLTSPYTTNNATILVTEPIYNGLMIIGSNPSGHITFAADATDDETMATLGNQISVIPQSPRAAVLTDNEHVVMVGFNGLAYRAPLSR